MLPLSSSASLSELLGLLPLSESLPDLLESLAVLASALSEPLLACASAFFGDCALALGHASSAVKERAVKADVNAGVMHLQDRGHNGGIIGGKMGA